MHVGGRRIKPKVRESLFRRVRTEPLRAFELLLITAGTIVSALSSFFAWQAASSTAEQAKYASEALTSADANASFRTYIASWNRMCRAITPPQYFLTVGTPSFDGENLSVSATNLGFDGASFNVASYVDRVADAEDTAKDALVEFRTFAPEGIFNKTEQALTVIGYFYNFQPDSTVEPDAVKKQLIRASALCHYYTEEQIRWFKDKSHTIKPIIFQLQSMDIGYTSNIPAAPGQR